MTYLVDANVLSEPTQRRADPKVTAWLRAHEAEFVVDSVILGEIALGIFLLPTGRKRSARPLVRNGCRTHRLPGVGSGYCSPLGAARCGSKEKGHTLPVLDSTIAATALKTASRAL